MRSATESQNEVISTTFILLLYVVCILSVMQAQAFAICGRWHGMHLLCRDAGIIQNDVFDYTTSLI